MPSVTPPLILVNDGSFGFQGNHFGFNVTASIGNVVVVQGSTNMVNWLNLSTNTVGLGKFYFSDSFYTNYQVRFYRAKLQ